MCAQMLTNTHQKNAQLASDNHPIGEEPALARTAFNTPSRCSTHFQISATTIQAMRGTPNTRWRARIGRSSIFIAAAATVAGNSSNGFLVELTIGSANARAALFRGGLDLLVDVGADPFERVVERDFADD